MTSLAIFLFVVAAIAAAFAMFRLPSRTRHKRAEDGDGPFLFPAGFLWGAATADQQIEHQQPSDWTEFELRARTEDGLIKGFRDVSDVVMRKKSNFDEKYAEDLKRASAMGHNAHRFSISWARLFPREDMTAPDPAGIEFYGRVLEELKRNGLVPFVTLFHFASPAWLWRESGGLRGLERADAVAHFVAFVDAVVKAYGSSVRFWCTLNEPMVYAYEGYLDGAFPPNEKRGGPKELGLVVRALLRMHAAAYSIIHESDVDASVGVAEHVRAFMPWRNANPLDRAAAAMIDRAFVVDFLDAVDTGRLKMALTGVDEVIPGLRGTMDYVGINHYGRAYVKTGFPAKYDVIFHDPDEPGEEWSDVGWAADEAALTSSLVRFGARYGLPVYVLENGLADAHHDDARRQRFLVRHAHAMWRAVQQGADVRGYFHWSLVDNFEWAEGFGPRFGLHAIDYENDFARRARGSVDVYRAIASSNALSADLWRRYRR